MSQITAHELARQLLECADLPVTISVDISTGDHDAYRRVFTTEYFGPNDKGNNQFGFGCSEIVLLFAGNIND